MILVVGAGTIGTILATYLAAGGRDLRLYARPRDLALFAGIRTMRVDPVAPGRPPLLTPRPALASTLDLSGVEVLLIAVKYPALDALLESLPPIPATCTIVSTLNGLDAIRRIRARFPGVRAAAASVIFNGQTRGPLHARLATTAELVIGSDDTSLLDLFRVPGLKTTRGRGEAAAWGKLMINLANPICALTFTTFKDLFVNPDLRRVYVRALDETTGALRAAGQAFDLPLVVPFALYRWMLLHGGPLPWWFAKYRNGIREGAYPSMVADVQAGRLTEIEQLNGEVVKLGLAHRYATPVNARLVEEIQALPGRPAPPMTPRQLREKVGG